MACKHLQEAQESYWCHFKVVSCAGLTMLGAGLCLILHALCPWICVKIGSTLVNSTSDFFKKRARNCKVEQGKLSA